MNLVQNLTPSSLLRAVIWGAVLCVGAHDQAFGVQLPLESKPGTHGAAVGEIHDVDYFSAKLAFKSAAVKTVVAHYRVGSRIDVCVAQDFLTGDLAGTFARPPRPGDRWIQTVCKNGRYFWEASPEFSDGHGGTWIVRKLPASKFSDAHSITADGLPSLLVRDLMGLRELRLAFDPPHVWFFRQLSSHEPLLPIQVKSETLNGDRTTVELSTGKVANTAEIIYKYELRTMPDEQVVWDKCSVLFNMSADKPPVELARFEYSDYSLNAGMWLPRECVVRRFTVTGEPTEPVLQISFASLEVNTKLEDDTFSYTPPFGSFVTDINGRKYRQGYADPSARYGHDVNDTRSGEVEPGVGASSQVPGSPKTLSEQTDEIRSGVVCDATEILCRFSPGEALKKEMRVRLTNKCDAPVKIHASCKDKNVTVRFPGSAELPMDDRASIPLAQGASADAEINLEPLDNDETFQSEITVESDLVVAGKPHHLTQIIPVRAIVDRPLSVLPGSIFCFGEPAEGGRFREELELRWLNGVALQGLSFLTSQQNVTVVEVAKGSRYRVECKVEDATKPFIGSVVFRYTSDGKSHSVKVPVIYCP